MYKSAWPRSSGVTAIVIAGSAITAITTAVVSTVSSIIAAVTTTIGSAITSGTATPLVGHISIVISCILIYELLYIDTSCCQQCHCWFEQLCCQRHHRHQSHHCSCHHFFLYLYSFSLWSLYHLKYRSSSCIGQQSNQPAASGTIHKLCPQIITVLLYRLLLLPVSSILLPLTLFLLTPQQHMYSQLILPISLLQQQPLQWWYIMYL